MTDTRHAGLLSLGVLGAGVFLATQNYETFHVDLPVGNRILILRWAAILSGWLLFLGGISCCYWSSSWWMSDYQGWIALAGLLGILIGPILGYALTKTLVVTYSDTSYVWLSGPGTAYLAELAEWPYQQPFIVG